MILYWIHGLGRDKERYGRGGGQCSAKSLSFMLTTETSIMLKFDYIIEGVVCWGIGVRRH